MAKTLLLTTLLQALAFQPPTLSRRAPLELRRPLAPVPLRRAAALMLAPNPLDRKSKAAGPSSGDSDGGPLRGGGGGGGGGQSRMAAAGAVASSAIIFEGVQIAGTAALFALGQRWTGATSPVELVSLLISSIQDMGAAGYGLFAALMIFFQVVPIAAAFVLTVSAGAIFGTVKGTAMVLTCSTASAAISFQFSRTFGRELVLESAQESAQFRALDKAFSSASYGTSLLLITLLRLSPVLPFSWANYLFGISPVPLSAFSLGTFFGCLPAVTAYVNAGRLGAEIVVNGAEGNDLLLAVGVAATIGAITVAGNIASKALKDMDIDLES